ncbi:MAG: autotransporter assembly complex protein TamA, partial [Pseudomonas sp.]|nr:autotransporter assembly complex protein TamA [Pseudomonas sp.]
MSVYGHIRRSLVLLLISTGAFAASELDVRVTPSNSALKANIEGYVGSLDGLDAQSLRRMRRIAENEADKAAQALGYYQARIRSRIEEGETPRLVLEVEPGERIRLRNVDIRIEGPASELSAFRVPSASRLKAGSVLNHGRYEDAKRLIQNQASRYGFFDGRFSRQRLEIDPAAGVADIELVFVSGPRYSLGDIAFSGDFPFDEELLLRMVPFDPDTPYDSELIAELYQALQSSGYFESVRVDAIPTQANQLRIPVTVALQVREPRTMGLGLGFSTDVGPRLRANWTRHWRNPQGHSYGVETELSAPRQNVGLWYDIPGDPPLTDKLRLAGGYQYEELASNDSLSRLLTLGPEWHSQRSGGWQRVLSVKWQREEYRLGDDSGLSTLLMPGVSYSLLRSDNRLDPNQGYRVQFDLRGAVDGVLSDANVLHGNVMLKGLTTVFDNHRLLGRVQFGGTETNGFSSVPPSLRFFAGGDQSVRGYDYQSLSPENNQGDKIGGRYLFAVSAEYQYSLTDKWRLATFIDQGNSFNSL